MELDCTSRRVAVVDLTGSHSTVPSLPRVYTGNTVTSLTQLTVSYAQNPDLTWQGRFAVSAGTTYQLQVGFVLFSGPIQMAITVAADVAPTITLQPQDLNAVERRDSPSFTVAAASATPLTYQWQFNSVNIPGAIDATLILPNVRLDQAGVYQVVVSNGGGSVTSLPARLRVGARPVNDDFANGTIISGPSITASGSNIGGTAEQGDRPMRVLARLARSGGRGRRPIQVALCWIRPTA